MMNSSLLVKFVISLIFLTLIINFVLYDVFSSFFTNKLKPVNRNNVREWVINGNITQYSAYFLTQKNFFSSYQYIEALLVLSFELESNRAIKIENYLKCLYKTANDDEFNKLDTSSVIKISFMPVKGINKKLYRVRCRINENLNSDIHDSIQVAIVAENEFENNKIPKDYIQYQRTNILKMNKSEESRNRVAHCVHMLRNLDERRTKRLVNWIEQQKAIGISKISIYMYDVSNELVDLLEKRYESSFLKLIKHPVKYEEVCKHQIMNAKMYPESSIYKNLLNICKNAHNYHFEMTNNLVSNTHERINTNDCFFNYKYDFKYVTTYDFDEIIFPRQYKLDHKYKELNDKNSLGPSLAYNIFEFADILFKKYSMKPSCLEFENVVFFQNDDKNLINFVSNLYNNTANKTELVIQNNDKKYVKFKLDSLEYVNNLKNKVELANILIKNMSQNSSYDLLWHSIFCSLMNMRSGKSIFSTDNTEGINQHYTDVSKSKENNCVKISTNDAFCGHFRENINLFFNDQTYSIKHFMIDIEYSLFISKFINNLF